MEERKGGIEKNKRATRMELKVKGRAEGGPDHTHREATGTREGRGTGTVTGEQELPATSEKESKIVQGKQTS